MNSFSVSGRAPASSNKSVPQAPSRFALLSLLAFLTTPPLAAQFQTQLNPKTDHAFDDYRKAAELKLDGRPRFPSGLKPGQVEIAPTNAAASVDVKDGLIHDWIAATVVPGATVDQALAVLQNYDGYKNVYKAGISDSTLLRRDGDFFHVYLRMVKKNVLTVVLNAEFDVQYRPLGNHRWSLLSRSTRIAELDGGRELPPGTGHGFLWRLNAYWILEPRPEGVYLECRTISLSRDIPFGLSLLIKPFVTSVPRESLQETMDATVRALR